jgi:hydroxymethylbilane synthase
MTLTNIRIATRQSPLALWQAKHILKLLSQTWQHLTIELIPMVTSGDKFLKEKGLLAGGKGLFVKELEEALFAKKADIAVHSTKDMPAELPEGLSLAVICKRENPLDALISKNKLSLHELPKKAIVGTASLRRQAQLLAYRPDLQVRTLRGNINTRLKQLETGQYDAIVLAAAGLERMGLEQNIGEYLPTDIMLPSCGQGALCIECRTDDQEIQELIAILNDPISSLCVRTERLVNAKLGGNCHVPLAVFCTTTSSNQLFLRAKILSADGSQVLVDSREGSLDQANILANLCAQSLLAKGGAALLETILS